MLFFFYCHTKVPSYLRTKRTHRTSPLQKLLTRKLKIVNAKSGKSSRYVNKFYLFEMENLSANFEKPSRSINRVFTENLTGLNAKKILR